MSERKAGREAGKMGTSGKAGATSEYEDIINLARPVSARVKMPREERAAQFAPFAALVGFARRVREMGAEHLEEVANEMVVEYEEWEEDD